MLKQTSDMKSQTHNRNTECHSFIQSQPLYILLHCVTCAEEQNVSQCCIIILIYFLIWYLGKRKIGSTQACKLHCCEIESLNKTEIPTSVILCVLRFQEHFI